MLEGVSCLVVMKLKQVKFGLSNVTFAFPLNRSQLTSKRRRSNIVFNGPGFRIDISIRLHAAFMNFQITLQYNGKSGWGAAISPCLVGHKRLKRLTKHTTPVLKLLKFNDTSLGWDGYNTD